MENPVDDTLTSLIEQPDIQRINVSDAPVNQPQCSPEKADLQTEQPIQVQSSLVVSLLLSPPNSLSLFYDIVETSTEVHDKSLGDLQQDTSDQPQLSIVEVPESSSAKNPTAHIRATSSALLLFLQVLTNLPFVQGTLAVILPDEVKATLTEVLPLLNKDIGQLVQHVEPIRAIFKQIQGRLHRDLKAKMHQVAFIENQQLVVEEAKTD
jgi:hypothetical protein